MKKTYSLKNNINIDIFEKNTTVRKKFIVYFHGGGLIYGSKNDIPLNIVEKFLNKGFTVISFDYYLAPNTSLEEIVNSTNKTIECILKEIIMSEQEFYFFGRSAGSFLMFNATKYLIESKNISPKKIINFYGFNDLNFIQNTGKVFQISDLKNVFPNQNLENEISDDPLFSRLPVYHWALNNKLLFNLYKLNNDNKNDFNIDPTQLKHFPPSFNSASISDIEVPFSYSKKISKYIPNSVFYPIYYLDHDFLHERQNKGVNIVIDKLMKWI